MIHQVLEANHQGLICECGHENTTNPEVLVVLLTDIERWLGNRLFLPENTIPLNDYQQVACALIEAGQSIGTMLVGMDKPVVAYSLVRLAWERLLAAIEIKEVGAVKWAKEHKVPERRKQYIEGLVKQFPELELDGFKRELAMYEQIGVGKNVRQPKAPYWEKIYEPYARGSQYVHFIPRPKEEIIGPVQPYITDYLVGVGHVSVCTIFNIAKSLWERDYGQQQ